MSGIFICPECQEEYPDAGACTTCGATLVEQEEEDLDEEEGEETGIVAPKKKELPVEEDADLDEFAEKEEEEEAKGSAFGGSFGGDSFDDSDGY